MGIYGCEPPWLMTSNSKTCETDMNIKSIKSADTEKISDFIFKIQNREMFDLKGLCMKKFLTCLSILNIF